jgi:hypothetical protein
MVTTMQAGANVAWHWISVVKIHVTFALSSVTLWDTGCTCFADSLYYTTIYIYVSHVVSTFTFFDQNFLWISHHYFHPIFCATNRKVAGLIPDGVIGLFRWHNPSDCTMALGSTQPLTEMSTRSISWGKGGRCVRPTILPPYCAVFKKSGNLNFLEPSGPLQACNGTAFLFSSNTQPKLPPNLEGRYPILNTPHLCSIQTKFYTRTKQHIKLCYRNCSVLTFIYYLQTYDGVAA